MPDIEICNKVPLDSRSIIFILKPDAHKRDLVNEIINKLRGFGFSVLAKKTRKLSSEEVKNIYKKTFERDYDLGANDPRAEKAIRYMTSGLCVGLLLHHKEKRGSNLFSFSRRVKGTSWIPDKCEPNSIRYKLRDISFDDYCPEFNDGYLKGAFPENLLHSVDNELEQIKFFDLFFQDLVNNIAYVPPLLITNVNKKIDVLFCVTYSNSSSEKMRIKMHSGVTHLCSFINENSFRAIIRGYANESIESIVDEIDSISPKYIAFSPVASEFGFIRKISSMLRNKNPNIIQIGGGPHFTIFPQDLISSNLDAICIGEGEQPLLSLLSGNIFYNTPGWVYRKGGKLLTSSCKNTFIENINELPIADHRLWNNYKDQLSYPHRRILASRGCPYNCTYCSNFSISSSSSGKYVRFRSPENIEKELLFILRYYPNVECIFFESEIFHPKLGLDKEIFSVTKKYKDKLYFGTNLRIGVFDEQYLSILRDSGFTFAYVGIESGNEEIRKKVLNRNYSNEETIKIFNDAKKIDFKLNSYNLIGLPEETPEKFEDTIELNEQCQPNEAQLSIFFPYPGSELYYSCLDKGYLNNPYFHYEFVGYERKKTILNMPEFREKEIMRSYSKFRSIFG